MIRRASHNLGLPPRRRDLCAVAGAFSFASTLREAPRVFPDAAPFLVRVDNRQGRDRRSGARVPVLAAAACIGSLLTSSFTKQEGETSEGAAASDDNANFVRWLRSYGIPIAGECPSSGEGAILQLAEAKGKGKSVTIEPSAFSTGSGVVSTIPRRAIVDVQTLLNGDGVGDGLAPEYFRDWLRATLADKEERPLLTERRILMLYYLCESKRSPYLRTFPRIHEPCTPLPPLFWPHEERTRLLKGTEIMGPLLAKEKALLREWSGQGGRMKGWLRDLRRLAAEAAGVNDEASSAYLEGAETDFFSFCWADSVFWTRVLQYSAEPPLGEETDDADADVAATYHWVPMVDACNHSYAPSCYWSAEKGGDVSLMYSAHDAPEKDNGDEEGNGRVVELCYAYGEKSNAELLFSHGFCVDHNPYDAVTWSLLEKDDNNLLTENKIRFLQQIGIYPQVRMLRQEQELDFDEEALGHFDLDSLYILFLIVMTPEEFSFVRSTDAPSSANFSSVRCSVSGVEDSEMTIESYDDFEEFCDDQCDILIPRVIQLLEHLLEERRRSLMVDKCYSSIDRHSENPRERFTQLLLLGQLQLIKDVQIILDQSAKTDSTQHVK